MLVVVVTVVILILSLGLWILLRPGKRHYPELKGCNVLITGASKGIGEELAYAFSKQGSRLLLTARSKHLLENVARNCKDLGAQEAHLVEADMEERDDVKRLHKRAVELFGEKVGVVVLNHAYQVPLREWRGSEGELEELGSFQEVNFFSYVTLTSLFLPSMKKANNGRIVVVSSILGKMALPFMAPYASTKFALQGFFGSLQHELSINSSGVSITLAVLGRIDTQRHRELAAVAGFVRAQNIPPAAPVKDTAEAILDAAYRRKREFYFPPINRLAVIGQELPVLDSLLNALIAWRFERK